MTRDDILVRARAQQASAAESGAAMRPLRVILEFEQARNPEEIRSAIRTRLGIETSVTSLFASVDGAPADPVLEGFFAVILPNVRLAGVDGHAFELAYAIADATGGKTSEPELGTDFYSPPDPGLEGAIEVPGCWVPEADDIATKRPRWAVDKIKARTAWDLPPAPGGKSRGQGVFIFQPDTGVANHVELESGMLDFARAYDFVADRPGATDPLNYEGNPGHGTGTASVAASRTMGKVVGSAPLATLVPLRAIERVVVFDHGRVAAAVEHARRNGANVITMSLGGAWSSSLRAAIRRAIDDGIIVMAAAGNCVKTVVWPARYEEVIAVSGINEQNKPWRGSCYGEAVDISAPAEFVPRAKRNPGDGGGPNTVAGGQGTSFAVAITAGVAALWVAHYGKTAIENALQPGGTVQQLFVSLLQSTAWRPDGFDTSSYGAGIVDGEALLKAPLASGSSVPATVENEYRSVKSLVAETAAPVEATAAIDYQRFVAELSHIALAKHRASLTGSLESAEAGSIPVPASESLRIAVARSGSATLEALVAQ
jgi:serine protease